MLEPTHDTAARQGARPDPVGLLLPGVLLALMLLTALVLMAAA